MGILETTVRRHALCGSKTDLAKVLAQRNVRLAAIALVILSVAAPFCGAMAQSRGGSGIRGGASGVRGGAGEFRGGYGRFRGGYGGFRGYGGPRVGVYLGGPYFGWPYYYGFPYGYPYPYGYYDPYPYPADGYPYPSETSPGSAAAPQDHWYYCDDPKGYYPYVASCKEQWREVSPTPVSPPPPTPSSSAGQ